MAEKYASKDGRWTVEIVSYQNRGRRYVVREYGSFVAEVSTVGELEQYVLVADLIKRERRQTGGAPRG
jgi:hypothetical protein